MGIMDKAVKLGKSWGNALKANGTVERTVADHVVGMRNLKNSGRVSGAKAQETIDTLKKGYRDISKTEGTGAKVKAYKQMLRDSSGSNGFVTGAVGNAALARQYFTGGSKAQNAIRMGTVGGGTALGIGAVKGVSHAMNKREEAHPGYKKQVEAALL